MEVEIKEEPADDDLQLQAGDATWQIVEEWSDGSAAQLSSTQENQSKQDQEGNTASELSEMSAQSVLTEQPMLFEMNSTSEENVSFVPTSEQESLNRAFKETFSEASEDKQGKQPTPVFLLMPTQDGIMYCSTEGPQSNLAYVTGTPNEPTTFTDPLKTDSAQALKDTPAMILGKGSSSSSVENKKLEL
nr:hypothetical protein BaRGS_000584 [Batillaria attramentaria]